MRCRQAGQAATEQHKTASKKLERGCAAAGFLLLAAAAAAHADKPRKPPAPNPAASYPQHEVHAAEHVTIAVQPGDTKETDPDTRLDYFHHGYMPLRIIVTNDGDQPVEMDQARILFVAADNSVTNSATEDDLQRRMFTMKQVQPTRVPLVPIVIHHAPVDKKIVADMDDFGFPSSTVAPHSTAAGWLFYDVRDLDEPVLDHAVLELRKIRFGGSNKVLDTFEIPLKKGDGKEPGDDVQPPRPSNDAVLQGGTPVTPVNPSSNPTSTNPTGGGRSPTVTTKPCDDPPCTDTTRPQ